MARLPIPRGRSTGCLTCRIRRVKCDEGKPHCQKCTSTGRKCDGYASIPFSREELKAASQRSALSAYSTSDAFVDLLPTLISDATFRNAAEKRYFQFFRLCTVRDTNLTTDSRFWDRVVLQASHAEPAVKHAILALGSYHNSTMQGNASEITRHHLRYADEQYLKALGEAKLLVANASPRQIERVLIVCILFILYEGMKGNYAVSQAHMDNARAIAAQSRKNQKPALLRTRLTEVGDTLARMDILALTFSETTAPYRYTLDDLLGTGPDLYPTEFSDLTQATASLIDIVRWMLVSGYDYVAEKLPGNTPWSSIVETEVDVRRERLRCWKRHWDQLMLAQPDLRDALSTLNVELWYSFAKINLDAGLIDSEMRFDRSMDEFKHVVELGDAVSSAIAEQRDVASFGLDIGFIFPMFFAIIRCRDPQLRRTMIEQLQRHRRRESTWESVAAAGVAQKWMEVEEEGLDSIESAADVPEGHRMSMLDIKVNVETGTASLHFHSSFRDHVVNDFPLGLTTMDP